MGQPKKWLWGNINLGALKTVITASPQSVGEYNGEKQIKVSATQWDDDGISIEFYDKETKQSTKLCNLRLSENQPQGSEGAPAPTRREGFKEAPPKKSEEVDLPF